jgi:PIN domain nuclease of toxin-antitoxin system
MRLLLDTHALLWFASGDPALTRAARRRIEDPRNDRVWSTASVWEMAIKVGIGKLHLGMPVAEFVERVTIDDGVTLLDIRRDHVVGVADLPGHHRDPFDRLLIVQALRDDLAIVTRDEVFEAYGVRRIW